MRCQQLGRGGRGERARRRDECELWDRLEFAVAVPRLQPEAAPRVDPVGGRDVRGALGGLRLHLRGALALGAQLARDGVRPGGGAGEGEERDGRNVEELRRDRRLARDDRIVHDGGGADFGEPPEDAGQLQLELHVGERHARKVLAAALRVGRLLRERLHRAKGTRRPRGVQLGLGARGVVERRARVLDRVPELREAKVVHVVAARHQLARDRERRVDVARHQREDEGQRLLRRRRLADEHGPAVRRVVEEGAVRVRVEEHLERARRLQPRQHDVAVAAARRAAAQEDDGAGVALRQAREGGVAERYFANGARCHVVADARS